MDFKRSSLAANPSSGQSFSRGGLGALDAGAAAMVVQAAGDLALVLDRDGVIRDMAIASPEIERDGAGAWLDRPWSETATAASRHKVDRLLAEAMEADRSPWRELDQFTPLTDSIIVRYTCIYLRSDKSFLAIGRDDRVASSMHQRLIEAQQSIERDYSRLRDARARYLVLFQTADEAVLVVDMTSTKIVDANPAAERLLASAGRRAVGEAFARLFDAESGSAAASLLSAAESSGRAPRSPIPLTSGGRELLATAASFRQGRAAQCLVRLIAAASAPPTPSRAEPALLAVLERMPDAFVTTDADLRLLTANAAFLDLTGVATAAQAVGQPLGQFLGRADLDRNLLRDTLREHGSVRNFATVLRDRFAEQEDVEVSAVSVDQGGREILGFVIRGARKRPRERLLVDPDSRRSVEQLTELVGRMKLKDVVRDSTDIVERLCIEAALDLTKGNRAAAADLLGVSRQGLYSKLHRFGMAASADNDH